MDKPRNIFFGQMTRIEVLQVLVDGKMPNGEIIEQATRLESLATIIPLIKRDHAENQKVADILRKEKPSDVTDFFIVETDEVEELIKSGEKLLA